MTAVRMNAVSVDYGDGRVLDSVDLDVDHGSTVAVLGPSGSGKSSLLGAIAGLVPVVEGEIYLSGTRVTGSGASVGPEDRGVAMVFQDFSLWPHLSVLDTVAYPIRMSGVDRAGARSSARRFLELFGIAGLADRFPDALSGGQQQRVGLARALARNAGVMLFDEPTAHLDVPLRSALAEEIRAILSERGAAAVLATHDAAEALATSDRIVLLREGRVVQAGSPVEVYERPVDEWAARLTGMASLITGVVSAGDGVARVKVDGAEESVIADGVMGGSRAVVRPEWVTIGGPLPGRVSAVSYRGGFSDHHLETSVGDVTVRTLGPPMVRAGDRVGWRLDRVWLIR
jgi:ABC-type Fe3+/spermidine/putrescine transport system ATPase subunit